MEKRKKLRSDFVILLLAALLLRVVLACVCKGFKTDVGCFYSWALRAVEGGLPNFYEEGVFTDYPPGYVLVLYVVGIFLKLFHSDFMSASCLLLIKMPAILCDLVTGVLVYEIARKRMNGNIPLILSAAYLLNPAVLYNSVVWGQVDSVFTLTVVLVCMLMEEGKTIPAYFIFVIGVLLKPQTLVFAPLVLLGIYDNVFVKDFSWSKFRKNLLWGLGSIACMFWFCVPFGVGTIFKQYADTMGSYPYVSVNAYNFWGLLGKNWYSQDDKFIAVSYKSFGILVILLICVFSVLIFLKSKECKDKYYVTGAFIIGTMFCFSVRMHERYLFPIMILLLLAFIENRNRAILIDYILISCFHLLNVWHVLTFYGTEHYDKTSFIVRSISFGIVLIVVCFYIQLFRMRKKYLEEETEDAIENKELQKPLWYRMFGPVAQKPVEKDMPITRIDILWMVIISLFYAIFAFINLGDTKVPVNAYRTEEHENIILNLPADTEVTKFNWYLGDEFDPLVTLWQWNPESNNWDHVQDIKMGKVFSWGELTLDQPVHGNICLLSNGKEIEINELVLLNDKNQVITPTNAEKYEALFDEVDLLPKEFGFMNSSYFDEIYYTRTAYEMRYGRTTYEWTHPPLGKILIMIGMSIFGPNPFGFRFMGTFFGVMMLPFIYLLARNITRNRLAGAFAEFIFAFDFMHFSQTRITTIDVFITFFVILMYYFMEKYTRRNFLTENLKSTWIPLGASGIAFGFGIASKWTGFYAGAGLFVIFLSTLIRRLRESIYLYQNNKHSAKSYWHSRAWKDYRTKVLKTALFCVIFFIIIPLFIYTLSYLPFRTENLEQGLLSRMLKNQKSMLSYHSGLKSTHPYSSMWYEWPTMIKPILYYSKDLGNDLVRGISAFGNPLVWWAGIPAFVYMMYLGIKKQDRVAGFLCIGYLAQYLPWALVSRVVFIYHYFPSVPFVALMIGYSLNYILRDRKKVSSDQVSFVKTYKKEIVFGTYAVAVFVLFLMFYPVLSGAVVKRAFAVKMLKWLKSWALVI